MEYFLDLQRVREAQQKGETICCILRGRDIYAGRVVNEVPGDRPAFVFQEVKRGKPRTQFTVPWDKERFRTIREPEDTS